MQVRIPSDEVAGVIRAIVDDRMSWEEVTVKYPAQGAVVEEDGEQ